MPDWLAKKLIVAQKLGYCGVIHSLGGFREVALRFDFVFLWSFIGLSAGERGACFSFAFAAMVCFGGYVDLQRK